MPHHPAHDSVLCCAPGVMLQPPRNFALVETGVYRSAYPAAAHAPFLASLKLRCVVTLGLEALPLQIARAFFAADTTVVSLAAAAWAARAEMTEHSVVAALASVFNRDAHPLLLCCPDGDVLTGTVVACLRRCMGWAVCSALAEYGLFTARRPGQGDVAAFIEHFDVGRHAERFLAPRLAVQQRLPLMSDSDADDAGATEDLVAPLPLWYITARSHAAQLAADHAAAAATDAEALLADERWRVLQHRRNPPLVSDPSCFTAASIVEDEDD